MAVREDPPTIESWVDRLQAPASDPGTWYMVLEVEQHRKATDAVTNLRRRKYKVPEPDANWSFRASKGKVYAGIDVPDV